MGDLTNKLAGKFIVIDGPDGAGKTTQLKLLGEFLRKEGLSVLETHDPGGTPVGDKIREILLDRNNGGISPMCETLLFMASRAQLVHDQIRPALENRQVVLCDRFVSATIAYQGASGVDRKLILELAEIAIQGTWPDLTIVLDLPVEEGMRRIGIVRDRLKKKREPVRGQATLFGDRMEMKGSAYHEQVREGFKELGEGYPGLVRHVEAGGKPEQVFSEILKTINQVFSIGDAS